MRSTRRCSRCAAALTMRPARQGRPRAAASPWPPRADSDPALPWVASSALGSALLLATTNAITQWSAVVPFLWIVPLSLYLLTFVVAFGHPRTYRRLPFGAAFLLLAGTSVPAPRRRPPRCSCAARAAGRDAVRGLHDLPWRDREAAAGARAPAQVLPRHRGGWRARRVAVVLVAPLAFSDYFEHPLVLCAIAAVAVVPAAARALAQGDPWPSRRRPPPWRALFFLGGLARHLARASAGRSCRARAQFLRRREGPARVNEDDPKQSQPRHAAGRRRPGRPIPGPRRRMEPICGFDAASALGLAVAHNARRRAGGPQTPLRIGVVGLGAGMIAALGRRRRHHALLRAQSGACSHLATATSPSSKEGKAKTDVLLGDGRLVLERQLQGGRAPELRRSRPQRLPRRLPAHAPDDQGGLRHLPRPSRRRTASWPSTSSSRCSRWHRCTAAWPSSFGMQCAGSRPRGGDGCEAPISWALYTRDKAFFDSACRARARSRPGATTGKSELVWTDQRQQPDEHHQLETALIRPCPYIGTSTVRSNLMNWPPSAFGRVCAR